MARSRADLSGVEHVHLSHWHRDHSGGLPRAISLIKSARVQAGSALRPPVVDVHPDRPVFRGFRTETFVASLEADPTFEELEAAGGKVVKRDEPHGVLEDMFLVSGEVPRRTGYEVGFPRGVRLNGEGEWVPDELIRDERFVVCNLKGTLRTPRLLISSHAGSQERDWWSLRGAATPVSSTSAPTRLSSVEEYRFTPWSVGFI